MCRHKMVTMYFGSIGCGKTTLACRILLKSRLNDEYEHYYANFETSLANFITLKGLGTWTLQPNSLLIIDEAGIEYNSRKYKSFPMELIQWVKLSRHYGVDIILISQSWDDVDVTFRRLVTNLYHLKKILCFTMVRRIYKTVGIDNNTHQIIDRYRFGGFLANFIGADNHRIFLRNGYYRYFNSYSAPATPAVPTEPIPPLKTSFLMKLRYLPTYIRRGKRKLKAALKLKVEKIKKQK